MRAHAAQLNQRGIAARIVEVKDNGTAYRVEAGEFTSLDDAGRYGLDLYARGALTNFILVEAAPAMATAAVSLVAEQPAVPAPQASARAS